MRGGLTRRTIAASVALAVIVGVAFAVLVVVIADLRDAARQAQRSEAVLAAANHLERLLIDVETGERGFIITGDERFLEPWTEARRAFPAQARELERLAASAHAGQGRRAQAIAAASQAYIDEHSVPTVEAARRDPAAARTVEVTLDGKRRVDTLRRDFDGFAAVERRLSAAGEDQSRVLAHRAIAAAAAGIAGSVLLVVVFAAFLVRGIVAPIRRAAAMAGRLAGGDLSVRMAETGPAEIGALERAFNAMAASLEASGNELRRLLDELRASRARVVAASDETRRRIERDLHDGIQQRLVSLALDVRAAEAMVRSGADAVAATDQLSQVAKGLAGAVEDLQDITRGIHPAILSKGGLGPALKTLARRSAVPVELHVGIDRRLPEGVEVALYYLVAEALTNAAKHAGASVVRVELNGEGDSVEIVVADDGAGGADTAHGSGLVGLKDRIDALGGHLEICSPPGRGTVLAAAVPVGPAPGVNGRRET